MVLLLIAPGVLGVDTLQRLLFVEDQVVFKVIHVAVQLLDLACQHYVRARILVVDSLEVGDLLMQVSERDVVVRTLVLEDLCLEVFDRFFLFLYRRSVSFADGQQPFVLFDELLHPSVKEVLRKVLRHLHSIGP